ncbi:hypothetical protein CDPG_00001 [Cellulophaga phage phi47:1]|nr:hypothetical protein CDPG_00001 [Cellulophaga phage phi47:1]
MKIYKDRIDCLPEKHKSLISYLLEQKEIKKCEYFKEISIAEAKEDSTTATFMTNKDVMEAVVAIEGNGDLTLRPRIFG